MKSDRETPLEVFPRLNLIVNSKDTTKPKKKVNYLTNYQKYNEANKIERSNSSKKGPMISDFSVNRSKLFNQWSIDSTSESSEVIMRIEEIPVAPHRF